jgi:ribosomal protein L37AE/L43A
MSHFFDYKFCCPNCGSTHFHKRHKFHLIAKYKCHKCKGYFTKPTKIHQLSNASISTNTQNINRKNKSFIKFKH